MERARATWTDERLDDLARHIDSGFHRLDADIRELRTLIIQLGGGTIATVLGTFVALLVAS